MAKTKIWASPVDALSILYWIDLIIDRYYVMLRKTTSATVVRKPRRKARLSLSLFPQEALPGFPSLVLGVYEKGKLIYSERVGTGFTFKQRSELKKQLDKSSRQTSPLAVVPKDPGLRLAQWTEPKMIAEVAFMEWTSDGSIRHPSFQGLREDKNSRDVVREQPSGDAAKSKRKSKSSR